jgi:hypothetical protein
MKLPQGGLYPVGHDAVKRILACALSLARVNLLYGFTKTMAKLAILFVKRASNLLPAP